MNLRNPNPQAAILARGQAPGRAGFTALEILVVVLVLGIVALVAIPSFTSGDGAKLDLAASEVASALRFARSEALRTGAYHGTEVDTSAHRVRVFRLDTSGPPTALYDVYHPVDKKLYDMNLHTGPFTAGVQVSDSDFRFGGVSTQYESVAFDSRGGPVSPIDLAPMDQGEATLALDGDQRTVAVQPVTGRVTVQ